MTNQNQTKSQIFLITGEGKEHTFSTSWKTSDYFENQILLNHTIGTLVKKYTNGNYVNYLTKTTKSTNSFKNWHFTFKDNLRDSLNSPINSKTYKDILEKNISLYYKHKGEKSLLVFSDLIGIKDFLNGKADDITGIIADKNNNALEFSFNKSTVNFNEILTMPYFGFLDSSEINNQYSSAEFKIQNISKNSVKLIKIKNKNSGFKELEIISLSQNSFDKININNEVFSIIRSGAFTQSEKPSKLDNYLKVNSLPSILSSLIFGKIHHGYFSNDDNRAQLIHSFTSIFENKYSEFFKGNVLISDSFYFDSRPLTKPKTTSSSPTPETLYIAKSKRFSEQQNNFFIKTIQSIYPKTKIISEYPQEAHQDWMKTLLSGKYYDIRFTPVHTGDYFIPEAIQMMFCSQMGVSYPDPNNKVCSFLKTIDFNKPKENTEQLLRSIESEYYTWPLFRFGQTWHYPKKMNLSNVPTEDFSVPYIDYLIGND